ncbi:MAG: hypothetical protein WD557_03470 [Dehalococcoidia bacterium]
MTDWSTPAPVNPEKPNWLHDQAQLPGPPVRRLTEYAAILGPLVLGLVFTGALVALAFWSRASWESHRDWVVPVTVPLLAIGGVAIGYLAARRAWAAAGPAFFLLALAAAFVASNIWRGTATEGSDGLRDALSIMSGVTIALAVAAAVGGMVFVEKTRPTRPPAAEM